MFNMFNIFIYKITAPSLFYKGEAVKKHRFMPSAAEVYGKFPSRSRRRNSGQRRELIRATISAGSAMPVI